MINKKRIVSILIVLMIILTGLQIKSYAGEVKYSHWAAKELVDAERLGIYETSWYRESFTKEITDEQVDSLMKNIKKRLNSLKLEENKDFSSLEVGNKKTREGILKVLFNELGKYDSTYDGKEDPIDYLLKENILKGDKKGLKLDEKVSAEEAVIFAKRMIMNLYRTENQGSKGFIWEIENKGNKAYLLGSIHLADESIYPLSKEIQEAYHSSDELLVEVDLLEPTGMENMISKMYFTDGRKLKDIIGKDLYLKVKKIMDQYKLEENVYSSMKPWAVSLQLSNLSMTDGGRNSQSAVNHGIDMYFLTSAKVGKKPIRELEGMDFQIDLFNELTMDKQIALLEESIYGLDTSKREVMDLPERALKEMLLLWKEGKDEEFKRTFFPQGHQASEINSLLLGKRDEGMAGKIGDLLEGKEGKTYFVVVGAAHYLADGGVLDILRDKGYETRRINNFGER